MGSTGIALGRLQEAGRLVQGFAAGQPKQARDGRDEHAN
jgi:hypothetical protein